MNQDSGNEKHQLKQNLLSYNNNIKKQKKLKKNEVYIEAPVSSSEETTITRIFLLKISRVKQVLMCIVNICTLGIPLLIGYWWSNIGAKMHYNETCNIYQATHVLIYCENKTYEIKKLRKKQKMNKQQQQEEVLIVLDYKYYQYYYNENQGKFSLVHFDLNNMTNQDIHIKYGKGIQTQEEIEQLRYLYGQNIINIKIKSAWKIFIDEILNPFQFFCSLSICVWILDDYQHYGIFILIVSLYEILTTIYKTKSNLNKLKNISYYESTINVFRYSNNTKIQISTCDLLPGDIFEVQDNLVLPCDAIILNGECIVNEALLTGESIPILKNALPYNSVTYSNKEQRQFTLFGGTKCLQTRYFGEYNVLALVTQTGFNTQKGQLIRQILFPKSTTFKFQQDSFKFICYVSILIFIAFTISLIYQVERQLDLFKTIMRSLELITINLPPSLPLCMQSVLEIALTRLKKQQIYCISPQRINISGRLDIMCFDKTGTLTEEGLNIYGIRPCTTHSITKLPVFQKLINDISINNNSEQNQQENQKLLEILCSCHSMTYIDDNQLIGDPLDMQMFQATGWILEVPSGDNYDDLVKAIIKKPDGTQDIGILQTYNFSSSLQRMSVIVRNSLNNKFELHSKGAPEKLREICLKETIPQNFHEILQKYTKQGYRVLALATRELKITLRKIHKTKRELVEKNLRFMGFLIMVNKLKPVSREVIENLENSNIKCIMATGDNALTAISVARDVSLVDNNEKIYLAELEVESTGKKYINWYDFECAENKLNPVTLEPIESDYDNPSHNNTKSFQMNNQIDFTQIKIEEEQDENQNNQQTIQYQYQYQQQQYQQDRSIISSMSQQQQYGTDIKMSQNVYEILSEFNPNSDINIPWFVESEDSKYVLAITGRTFTYILNKVQQENNPEGQYAKILQKILRKTKIYARMQPQEKANLIILLKAQGFIVGMCGDGANDCAALTSADIGVSLSETEASVAASFTSKIQDISCIIKIICEGRATLTTSFHVFKFTVFYSISQGFVVGILYKFGTDLTTPEYTYLDFLLSFYLAITVSFTKPYNKITALRPKSSLLSFSMMLSLIGQLLIALSVFILLVYILIHKPFYYSTRSEQEANLYEIFGCFENTVLFYALSVQYIASSLAFGVGKPFRKSFYKNYPYFFSAVAFQIYNIWIIVYPDKYSTEILELVDIPYTFRFFLLGILAINMIFMIFFDWVLVKRITFWYAVKIKNYLKKNKGVKIEQQSVVIPESILRQYIN